MPGVKGHMIVPWEERLQITPFHTIKRIQVVLDPDESHWMSGKKGERKLMLSKAQVEAIAEAIGFEILESKPITNLPEWVVWQVQGAVTGPDGHRHLIKKTYELDMRLKDPDGVDGGFILLARDRARERVEKIHKYPKDNYNAKTMPPLDDDKAWDDWAENQAMKDWTMTNRHRVRRAETGAALACIRSKCRIKGVYDEADFAEPWVVYRAEFDIGRALQAGGKIGEFALRGIGLSMTQSLGLPETVVAGLLEGIQEVGKASDTNGDLLNASEEEIEELKTAMAEVGFKDRAMCDNRTLEIFDLPLSQLTKRHVRIMHEYVGIGSAALAAKLEKEEMSELTAGLIDAARLAYAESTQIEEYIEEELLAKIYPSVEEEPQEESAEAEEGESEEEEAQEEEVEGESEEAEPAEQGDEEEAE